MRGSPPAPKRRGERRLISCTVAADCPDPAMVCLPCPAQFAADCPLGAAFGRGPDMCAWPDP